MSKDHPSLINAVTGQPEAACVTQSVVLSNADAGWRGVGIEQLDLPPFETPETCRQDHLLRLQLGPPITLEWRTEGRFQSQPQLPGDLCLVLPGTPHRVRWRGKSQILRIRLAPSLFQDEDLAAVRAGRHELVPQWGRSDPSAYHIGLALKAELEPGCHGGSLFRETLTTALVMHLTRRYSSGGAGASDVAAGLSQSKLRRATEYIHGNFARDVSLAEIAAAVSLSPSPFARQFRAATGKTPHQYLLRCRIDRGKTLLLGTDLPVGRIAQETVFADQSHFSRHFKRLTGVTPTALRAG